MRGLFVALLCATAGYSVKGSPLITLVDTPSEIAGTVSVNIRNIRAVANTASYGGPISQQPGIKPIQTAQQQQQQQQIHVGGQLGQQLGAKPIAAQLQPGGGLVNQQPGVNPFLQKPNGGVINQQSGGKPVVGSHLQGLGGLISQQTGVNPFLQGSQQQQTPTGGLLNQQIGAKPVGSQLQPSGGEISQQSGVQHVDVVAQPPVEGQVDGLARSHQTKHIGIVRQESEVNPDGFYHNVWESENGIKVQEEGTVKVNGDVQTPSVTGTISYIDPDGNPIVLTYIADENGFQPQGEHLPTSPPIPQSVARALEYIAAHPYVEEKEDIKDIKTTPIKQEQPVIEVA